MNSLVDEGVDRQIVDQLRQDGHAVLYIAEMAPGIAGSDKDSGELVYRQGRLTSGVVLIRLVGLSPIRKAEIVTAAIGQHPEELLSASAVVTPATARIRRANN